MILYPPTSLQDLHSFSDYTKVSCVGRSWPTLQPCNNGIEHDDGALFCAIDKLQSLSRSGLKNHGVGLIETLTSIALGFSCKTHRRLPGQRKQLPYYWIALDSMPNFLDCMGLKGPVLRDCSLEKEIMIWNAVHRLTSGEACYVYRALTEMDWNGLDQWWKPKKNGVIAKYFREALDNKLSIDTIGATKWREVWTAQEKWDSWHVSLNANNDHFKDEYSQDSTDLSDLDSEDEFDSVSVSSGFSDDASSDGQFLLTTEPVTPKDQFLMAEPDITTGPASAPVNMQTTSSYDQAFLSPTKQSSRHSYFPSSSSNSAPSYQKPRSAPSRRLFKSEDTLERPRILQTVRRRAMDGDVGLLEGQHATLNGEELRESSPSRSKNPENALQTSCNFVHEAVDCDPDANIPTPLKENPRGPEFRDREPKRSMAEVTLAVFKEMRKPLNNTTAKSQGQKDKGYIYALKLSDRPGFIKIGRTKNHIRDRKKAIETCTGGELELFNHSDNCSVIYHQKVEALVHAALRQYRRRFNCDCKLTGKCGTDKNFVAHGEWFEIDQKEAIATVCRWRVWMNGDPYHNGRLKDREERRIKFHEERISDLLNTKRKGEDLPPYDWDSFMSNSEWESYATQIYDLLHVDRPERNESSSRWKSITKYWHVNMIAFGCFLIYPLIMSAIIHHISWFAVLPIFAFGGLIIVYAA